MVFPMLAVMPKQDSDFISGQKVESLKTSVDMDAAVATNDHDSLI